MGKYFKNPFNRKEDIFIIIVIITILPLVIFKLLTLGAFQLEVFYEDVAEYLAKENLE